MTNPGLGEGWLNVYVSCTGELNNQRRQRADMREESQEETDRANKGKVGDYNIYTYDSEAE